VNESNENFQTLVIVGNGMVGWKLCQRLVELGAIEALRVIVFGEEPRPAYDRVHLTDLFSGKSPDNLILSPLQWYEDNGIELHTGDPVVFIDRDNCLVRSKSGKKVLYDRLVLATGSRPFVPPVEGTNLPGVFVYRTVEDLQAIMEYGTGVARAAVIGGGLLGLEAAKAVYDLGLDVHVIEFAPGLMPRQLDPTGSEFLKGQIERLGVHVHVKKQTSRIEAVAGGPNRGGFSRGARVLHFADGGRLAVDMVVISAGIRPRGELAEACGLDRAPNGAVVVDDHLRTSDPRIFAIGECANHRGITYGLAAPGFRMVDVLVDNLVGGEEAFDGADQSAKLKLMGITVASFGEHNENEAPNSTTSSFVGGGVYRKLVTRDGVLIGVVTVGDWENLDRVRASIDAPERISFWDMRRFRSTGNLWAKTDALPVYAWDAEATVCACLHVKRGALSQAYADGCIMLEDLSMRTGAGTMCGSCKPLLAEFLTAGQEEAPPPSRTERGPPSRGGAPLSRRDGSPVTVREGIAAARDGPPTNREVAPSTRRGVRSGPASNERTVRMRGDDDALARLDAIVQLRVEEMAAMKFKHNAVIAVAPAAPAPAPAAVRGTPAAVSMELEEAGPVALRMPSAWSSRPPSVQEEDSGPLSVRSPSSWHRAPEPDDDSGPLSVRSPGPRDPPPSSNGFASSSRPHAALMPVIPPPPPARAPVSLNGGHHTDLDAKPPTRRDAAKALPVAPAADPAPPPAARTSFAPPPRVPVMAAKRSAELEIDTKPSTTRRDGSKPPDRPSVLAAAEAIQGKSPARSSLYPSARTSLSPPERISFAPVEHSALKASTDVQPPSRHEPMTPSERVSFTSVERCSFTTIETGIVRQSKLESVGPPPPERDALLPPPVRSSAGSSDGTPALFVPEPPSERVKLRSPAIDSQTLPTAQAARLDTVPPASSQIPPPMSDESPADWNESSVPRRSIMPPLRPITLAPGRISIAPGRPSYAALLVPERGTRPMLAASIGALVLTFVIVFAGPIPFSRSYQGFFTDAIWLDRFWKLCTGYGLFAIASLSLIVSLRKRWKRFSVGDISIWRMIHGVMGGISLALLVLHTGLHLGKNLNRLLMINYLGLTLLGAVAGGIVGISTSLSATTARTHRRFWSRIHIALFWPLPILVLLHVLSAHYF
jgi:nitrite reductase (NADH) large subunit